MPIRTPKPKHDHHPLVFPEGFLWGAATSAYQVEGGNTNDWSKWEENFPEDRKSGTGPNQYELYEDDFDLAEKFNHNAHRLSVEWSRIEPKEGQFSEEALEHYCRVLKALKKRGMKVMLTLHHFTNPIWFAEKGGFENRNTLKYFQRYVRKIVPYFKDNVDFWITINEPSVYTMLGYLVEFWPPQKKSKWAAIKVFFNLAAAHKIAYKEIHEVIHDAKVGIAQNVTSFNCFHHHSLKENITVWFLDLLNNHMFYKITGKKYHDFLGLNYYFNRYVSLNSHTLLPSLVDVALTKKDVSDLGWEIHPDGIFDVLMDFSDYHLPIYITENGLASTNDDRRCRFLISYLKEIYHAIVSGIDVKGYFHWSLIDNFEWADGYNPRFGLIEVDYQTQKRLPRPSAYVFSNIIKHNAINHHLMRFIGHTITAEEVLKNAKECPNELCSIDERNGLSVFAAN